MMRGQNDGGGIANLDLDGGQFSPTPLQQRLERRSVARQRLLAQKRSIQHRRQQILAQRLLRPQTNVVQGHLLEHRQIARQLLVGCLLYTSRCV